jgi:DUF4097 and DUF4098 domain-containing protein YvlB
VYLPIGSKKMRFKSLIILSALILISCNLTINKSIRVKDGEVRNTGLNTVNGNIDVGRDCEIHGTCRAVNGSITIGARSTVQDLQTVNGRVDVEENGKVRGNIESVNGSVNCKSGTIVDEEISTVNGKIRLNNSNISGYLKTINGDIFLENSTTVEGNIIVKGEIKKGRVEIRINNNSTVKGDIIVDPDRHDVTVYLSSGGNVEGTITNAQIVNEG